MRFLGRGAEGRRPAGTYPAGLCGLRQGWLSPVPRAGCAVRVRGLCFIASGKRKKSLQLAAEAFPKTLLSQEKEQKPAAAGRASSPRCRAKAAAVLFAARASSREEQRAVHEEQPTGWI